MAPDVLPAHERLDAVEAGLDAIEVALARLDAGEVDEPVADDWVDEIPSDDPAEPDPSW